MMTSVDGMRTREVARALNLGEQRIRQLASVRPPGRRAARRRARGTAAQQHRGRAGMKTSVSARWPGIAPPAISREVNGGQA
jgi:hypothetical protein